METNEKAMRVLVVGRHTPDFGSAAVEVVEQRDVLFPAHSDDAYGVVSELDRAAVAKRACLVLQAVPVQVAVAIHRYIEDQRDGPEGRPFIGGIVSVPVAGEPGQPRRFEFSHIEWF